MLFIYHTYDSISQPFGASQLFCQRYLVMGDCHSSCSCQSEILVDDDEVQVLNKIRPSESQSKLYQSVVYIDIPSSSFVAPSEQSKQAQNGVFQVQNFPSQIHKLPKQNKPGDSLSLPCDGGNKQQESNLEFKQQAREVEHINRLPQKQGVTSSSEAYEQLDKCQYLKRQKSLGIEQEQVNPELSQNKSSTIVVSLSSAPSDVPASYEVRNSRVSKEHTSTNPDSALNDPTQVAPFKKEKEKKPSVRSGQPPRYMGGTEEQRQFLSLNQKNKRGRQVQLPDQVDQMAAFEEDSQASDL